jgi:hypothetical protein
MATRATVMAAGLGLGLAVAAPASAQVTIDDFRTGPYEVSIKSGADLAVQTGSMLGGYRMTHLIVGSGPANPLDQAGALDIRPDGPLVVDAGYQVGPRLEVGYGYGPELELLELDQDLAAQGDRFRLHFEASDRVLNVNIVVFTGSVYASLGYNLEASNEPFTHDFSFSDFRSVTAVDWAHIDSIILVVQSTSVMGGNDWALSKIEVRSGDEAKASRPRP